MSTKIRHKKSHHRIYILQHRNATSSSKVQWTIHEHGSTEALLYVTDHSEQKRLLTPVPALPES